MQYIHFCGIEIEHTGKRVT